MNTDLKDRLSTPHIQEFITKHEQDDPALFVLQQKEFSPELRRAIAEQIAARQKAKKKLPHWYKTNGILYPPILSMEQCSSEATARYKSSLIMGEALIDLTGGTGVDTYYLSQGFKHTIYVEQQNDLCELAGHNFSRLKANVEVLNQKAETFLAQCDRAETIYLDPARRGAHNEKVFRFQDCSPDVTAILPNLLDKANTVLVKAAPVLDIQQACRDLNDRVKEVHVLSWKGEVRELLFLINNQTNYTPTIHAVSVDDEGNVLTSLSGNYDLERDATVQFDSPQQYLYEPAPEVLKAGFFRLVSSYYNLAKLHANTHLYTSNKLVENFPGRVFTMEHKLPVQKKALKKVLEQNQANITTRNFPMSVVALRKKLSLKEGGNTYLFATSSKAEGKQLLVCKKVSQTEKH